MTAVRGLERAQTAYDAMEPPADPDEECLCLRWRCENCLTQYDAPGTCPDPDCREDGPSCLAELPADYLWTGAGLVAAECPVHGGCQCGDDRCRECG